MKNGIRTVLAVLLLVSGQVDVLAQADDPIPPAIRAKMDGYVGTWQVEEQFKATPTAAEETVTGTWTARWIFDSLVEWRGTIRLDDGSLDLVQYDGYDRIHQIYVYWFLSDGSRGYAYDGEWDGNTIRWQQVMIAADGQTARGRCTFPYNDDFTGITNYTCERLTDGEWWVWRRGTATKTSR